MDMANTRLNQTPVYASQKSCAAPDTIATEDAFKVIG